MLYHCQVMSLQVVVPPLHQRAPKMRSANRIGEVKVAEAEVLSVGAPAGPTVAVALALQTARPPASPIYGVIMKLQRDFGVVPVNGYHFGAIVNSLESGLSL